jgi:hypothetical protein
VTFAADLDTLAPEETSETDWFSLKDGNRDGDEESFSAYRNEAKRRVGSYVE